MCFVAGFEEEEWFELGGMQLVEFASNEVERAASALLNKSCIDRSLYYSS